MWVATETVQKRYARIVLLDSYQPKFEFGGYTVFTSRVSIVLDHHSDRSHWSVLKVLPDDVHYSRKVYSVHMKLFRREVPACDFWLNKVTDDATMLNQALKSCLYKPLAFPTLLPEVRVLQMLELCNGAD